MSGRLTGDRKKWMWCVKEKDKNEECKEYKGSSEGYITGYFVSACLQRSFLSLIPLPPDSL